MSLTEGQVVELIMQVSRTEARKFFTVDSCIATTRIVGEVYRYFGYTSEPVPMSLLVFNAKGFELFQMDVPLSEWPDDAWSLGIVGSGVSEGKRWDGHLVGRVNDRWLVDGSLDQASRPQRGLVLEPSVMDTEGSDWDWKQPNIWKSQEAGNVLWYEAMKMPGPWRESPDWKGRNREIRTAVAAAIRTLKPLLALVA